MDVELDISVADSVDADEDDIPDADLLQQWAGQACEGDGPAVVSVRIVDADEMRALNCEWRGRDRPTNVLSFPMELPDEIDMKMLGDIVLCADVIREEAIAQDKPLRAHWAHMVVHGMLHLQGYDHIHDDEADEMERREVRILAQLGFDNPYEFRQHSQQA